VLGQLEGMEKGIAQGIEQGMLIAAKNMKQAGIELNTIAQVTGLPIEQIAEL